MNKDKLNDELLLFVDYISLNKERLGLSNPKVTALQSNHNKWQKKYREYKNPDIKTSLVIKELNELSIEIMQQVNAFRLFLRANLDVDLTEEDKSMSGIKQRKTRYSKGKKPKEFPTIEVVERGSKTLKMLVYYRPSSSKTKKVSIPKDATLFFVLVAYQDLNATSPPTEDDYRYLKLVSSARFRLQFDSKYIGKMAYLKGFYVNSKGDEGLMSREISVIISN